MHRPEPRTRLSSAFFRPPPSSPATPALTNSPTIAPRPRLRDRLAARLRADRLDAALAAGVHPELDPALSLRARRLTAQDRRARLARSLNRARADALGASGRSRVPVSRTRVREAEDALALLAHRLSSPGPVAARGVALARALLTDGVGPLYAGRSADDLGAVALDAADALLLDG